MFQTSLRKAVRGKIVLLVPSGQLLYMTPWAEGVWPLNSCRIPCIRHKPGYITRYEIDALSTQDRRCFYRACLNSGKVCPGNPGRQCHWQTGRALHCPVNSLQYLQSRMNGHCTVPWIHLGIHCEFHALWIYRTVQCPFSLDWRYCNEFTGQCTECSGHSIRTEGTAKNSRDSAVPIQSECTAASLVHITCSGHPGIR